MTPFWNPQNKSNVLGEYLGIVITINALKGTLKLLQMR